MLHAHSGLRWIALILLLLAIFNAFSKMKSPAVSAGDRKINLFAMVTFHIQYLVGLGLYFTSPKVNFDQGWMKIDIFRFFGMEHVLMMTVAFILITMGFSKSKKSATPYKTIAIFYTIALILILAGIPWPFRGALGGSWF
ncbi:MAG TPA: hypothetical protein PKN22_04865 [Taishania sp.]|nr:hypothetical protein [Taishania sp.]HNS42069.1 hypothetical protein [Taishania sp.]